MTTAAETSLNLGLDRSEQRLRARLTYALGAGLLTLVLLVAATFVLYAREQAHSRWVEHTYAAEAKIARVGVLVERLETARRGYILAPRQNFWDTYLDTRGRVSPAIDDLANFVADNPRQLDNIADLRGLTRSKLEQMRSTIERARAGFLDEARQTFIVSSSLHITERMRARLDAMRDEEARLLTQRIATQQQTALLLLAVTLASAAALVALGYGSLWLMRRYADDLQRTQGALKRLNEGLEQAVRDRTADLTRANDEIQRFAYIVSHDLRSPLVNVMGFTSELEVSLETLRRQLALTGGSEGVAKETRLAIEEDIPEAIGFIRSSTKKMDRLINAILKLSREGRRTLTPEALSMDAVMEGIAASLTQLAQAREAEIAVEPHLPDLVSDRVAIEQVFSNLVENAVKYLKPGQPGRVVVRGRRAGGRVVFEVEDNGRGIDPRDHERIFELFRRSGPQDQAGEGIGLAHVRALVYRLGGVITCTSELGRGATFSVSLPPRIEADQGLAA